MSGLVLKLKPGERVMINGAVLVNGDRRTSLSVASPDVNVLRLKDAIHPKDVDTPVKRAIYKAQLVLASEANGTETKSDLIVALEELSQVFRDSDSRRTLDEATTAVLSGNFYLTMKSLKKLLPREQRILSFGGIA
ncbi:flagellar biosynthesis repressor FlbT [Paracoccaceae bacterium GXU_MW_L88]